MFVNDDMLRALCEIDLFHSEGADYDREPLPRRVRGRVGVIQCNAIAGSTSSAKVLYCHIWATTRDRRLRILDSDRYHEHL